jgi:hypothetical protein
MLTLATVRAAVWKTGEAITVNVAELTAEGIKSISATHRYTGVWVIVVEGKVFVRSWNDKPTGWYRAFLARPLGSIRLAGREIAVRVRKLWGERLRDAVTRAYAGKYDTEASEKWVRGFAEPGRAATTLPLMPVQPPPGYPPNV